MLVLVKLKGDVKSQAGKRGRWMMGGEKEGTIGKRGRGEGRPLKACGRAAVGSCVGWESVCLSARLVFVTPPTPPSSLQSFPAQGTYGPGSTMTKPVTNGKCKTRRLLQHKLQPAQPSRDASVCRQSYPSYLS